MQCDFLSSITMEMVTNGAELLTRFLGSCSASSHGLEERPEAAASPLVPEPWEYEPLVSQGSRVRAAWVCILLCFALGRGAEWGMLMAQGALSQGTEEHHPPNSSSCAQPAPLPCHGHGRHP